MEQAFTITKRAVPEENGVTFLDNAFIKNFLLGAFLLLLAGWGMLIYFIHPRETPLILHYNVYFGVDLLGAWWQAYVLQGVATVLFVLHTALGYSFYQKKDRFAAYILLLATNFILFGVAVASASIAFINY
ncbi:MAG: hypothetical protein AAB845_01840 [Patescibacteria group bacterium]